MMNKIPVIGITLGDMNSIAPEVIIKTLYDNRINQYCTPVLFGSPRTIGFWKRIVGLNDFQLNIAKTIANINHKRSNVVVCWDEEVEIKIGESTEVSGKYAFKSLEIATKHALEGKIDALVTAPLNKHNINNELLPFNGHTGYLAQAAGTNQYIMMLVSDKIKVGLVTGHVPLKDVSAKITKELIQQKAKTLHDSLVNDFGINKPRIAVLGLNPHAGDNGLLGLEDVNVIAPAVHELRNSSNMIIYGPYPADGFFGSGQYQKFDAVLAMYHDQGLIPFKLLSFESGVNYTAGLPFIRTSPDHGTAYNIAGKNQASEQSMRNAIYMAIDLWNNRNNNLELKANPLETIPLKRERFRMDF
ncbi:MAG: 4-hydroxythreonine-4-phosphate dehydrogenase PdxA [Bacteroidia bacterium]